MKYPRAFFSQLSQTFSYLTLLERQETDMKAKGSKKRKTRNGSHNQSATSQLISSILSFSRRLTSPFVNEIVPRGNLYRPLFFSRIVIHPCEV